MTDTSGAERTFAQSKRKIIFYGPPASGKSSLIRAVSGLMPSPLRHAVAIGLEAVHQNERPSFIQHIRKWNTFGPLLVGAADLGPEQIPADFDVICLCPDESEYLTRVDERNKVMPWKADQDAEKHYKNIWRFCHNNSDRIKLHVDPYKYGDATQTLRYILTELGVLATSISLF